LSVLAKKSSNKIYVFIGSINHMVIPPVATCSTFLTKHELFCLSQLGT